MVVLSRFIPTLLIFNANLSNAIILLSCALESERQTQRGPLGLSSLEPKRIPAKESIRPQVIRHFNIFLVLLLLGKWCRVERFDVPEEYVQVLLADMPNAFLNSTRERRHLCPPVWKDTAQVMHYRTYEIEDIVAALGQRSGITLHLKKSYLGEKGV